MKERKEGDGHGENMLLLKKKSELPLGTNIAQQAFCCVSKAFDFHSWHFFSV